MPAGVTGDPEEGPRALPGPRQGPVHGLPPGARRRRVAGRQRRARSLDDRRPQAARRVPLPAALGSARRRSRNTVDAAVGRPGRASRPRSSSTSSPISRRCTGRRRPRRIRIATRSRAASPSASATTSIRRTTPRVLRAEGAEALVEPRGTGRQVVRRLPPGRRRRRRCAAWRRAIRRYVTAYGRVMAIEDFLSVHGPETTGRAARRSRAPRTSTSRCWSRWRPTACRWRSTRRAREARAALARGRGVVRAARGRAQSRVRRLPHARPRRQQVPRRPSARRRHRRADAPLPDLAHEPERRRGTCAGAFSGA